MNWIRGSSWDPLQNWLHAPWGEKLPHLLRSPKSFKLLIMVCNREEKQGSDLCWKCVVGETVWGALALGIFRPLKCLPWFYNLVSETGKSSNEVMGSDGVRSSEMGVSTGLKGCRNDDMVAQGSREFLRRQRMELFPLFCLKSRTLDDWKPNPHLWVTGKAPKWDVTP